MSGLDPQGQKDLQELLTSLSHLTIIYASHQLEEIERFCSTVLMLHRGEIVRRLDLEEIQQEIFTMDLSPGVLNILPEFSELNPQMLSQEEDRVRIQVTTNTAQIQKFISALNAEQVIIKRLRSTGVLQELYHRYVSSEINPN
ncbi:MAG: hypothetical protein GWN62_21135 [Aliifodinibius sp.]|nr:hypothetical protein [Fodinibius sp.]